jgi:hypothetical protein
VLLEPAMGAFLTWLVLALRSLLKTRAGLEAENLVLRQQVIVLSRTAPSHSTRRYDAARRPQVAEPPASEPALTVKSAL